MISAKEAYYEVLEFRQKEKEKRREILRAEVEMVSYRIRNQAKAGNTELLYPRPKGDSEIVDMLTERVTSCGFTVKTVLKDNEFYLGISWENKQEEE